MDIVITDQHSTAVLASTVVTSNHSPMLIGNALASGAPSTARVLLNVNAAASGSHSSGYGHKTITFTIRGVDNHGNSITDTKTLDLNVIDSKPPVIEDVSFTWSGKQSGNNNMYFDLDPENNPDTNTVFLSARVTDVGSGIQNVTAELTNRSHNFQYLGMLNNVYSWSMLIDPSASDRNYDDVSPATYNHAFKITATPKSGTSTEATGNWNVVTRDNNAPRVTHVKTEYNNQVVTSDQVIKIQTDVGFVDLKHTFNVEDYEMPNSADTAFSLTSGTLVNANTIISKPTSGTDENQYL